MRGPVIHVFRFVCGNALVLMVPPFHQSPNSVLREHWDVTEDEPGMFSCDFDFPVETEIVTNEHRGTGDKPSRETLIMAISQTQNVGVVFMDRAVLDFHETEIPGLIVRERMSLIDDFEAIGFQCTFHFLDQEDVGDWGPRRRAFWRGDVFNDVSAFGMGATMQDEI